MPVSAFARHVTDCPNCGATMDDADGHGADGADYVCDDCGRKWQAGVTGELRRVFEKPTDERR
jgi:transposase-like protein